MKKEFQGLSEYIKTHSVFYVTKDKERALGFEGDGYNIFTVKDSDTPQILLSPEAKKTIPNGSRIIVFKNNSLIEKICKENDWQLLNPNSELSSKIENKISQIEWLGDLAKYMPEYKVVELKDLKWDDYPIVLQWATSHTGDGTILITQKAGLEKVQNKFGKRIARATRYIKGPVFTCNICINQANKENKIILGNISYQITGMLPFTENAFSTIGNDWSVTYSILSDKHIEKFKEISFSVGQKMVEAGWRGLFGIDIMYDEERDQMHLIEINARQPASSTFESQIQKNLREKGIDGTTIFESHLMALLNIENKEKNIEINDGAQIVQRLTNHIIKTKEIPETTELEKYDYNIIKYQNTKENRDLIRIQSLKGIMESHNKFNERGKEILKIMTK